MNNEYSFWKGFKKAVVSVILIGAPLVVSVLPADWANLTIGGALVLMVNYIKVKYSK